MRNRDPYWRAIANLQLTFDAEPNPQDVRSKLIDHLNAMTDDDIAGLVRKKVPQPYYVRLTVTPRGPLKGKGVCGTEWNHNPLFWSDFLKMSDEERAPWLRSATEWLKKKSCTDMDIFVHEDRLTDDLVEAHVSYEPDPGSGRAYFYGNVDLRPYLEMASDDELVACLQQVREDRTVPITENLDTMLVSRSPDTRDVSDLLGLSGDETDELEVTTSPPALEAWIQRNRAAVLDLVEQPGPTP